MEPVYDEKAAQRESRERNLQEQEKKMAEDALTEAQRAAGWRVETSRSRTHVYVTVLAPEGGN